MRLYCLPWQILFKCNDQKVFRQLTFSRTSSETVRDSMRQETAQLRTWKMVYMMRVLVEERTGGQKAQQSEQGAGPQQQHI